MHCLCFDALYASSMRGVAYSYCVNSLTVRTCFIIFLPARTNEQGNVIGSVRIYIHVCIKKIVIERTRDLIYLKFIATDFFPKIISPSAGENSGDLV